MDYCAVALVIVLSCGSIENAVVTKERSFRNFQHTHPWLEVSPLIRNRYEKSSQYYLEMGKGFVDDQLKRKLNTATAKNVVLYVGDGMSVSTLSAARMYKGAEEKSLSFEKFPFVGMAKTYCVNSQVADSACTATGIQCV